MNRERRRKSEREWGAYIINVTFKSYFCSLKLKKEPVCVCMERFFNCYCNNLLNNAFESFTCVIQSSYRAMQHWKVMEEVTQVLICLIGYWSRMKMHIVGSILLVLSILQEES